jgi:hypothetical protein
MSAKEVYKMSEEETNKQLEVCQEIIRKKDDEIAKLKDEMKKQIEVYQGIIRKKDEDMSNLGEELQEIILKKDDEIAKLKDELEEEKLDREKFLSTAKFLRNFKHPNHEAAAKIIMEIAEQD